MFKTGPFPSSLSYDQQGLIYFICHNYDTQPLEVKSKISKLCKQYGKDHAQALLEFLTTNTPIQMLSAKYCIDATVLYRARKGFYNAWYESAVPCISETQVADSGQ